MMSSQIEQTPAFAFDLTEPRSRITPAEALDSLRLYAEQTPPPLSAKKYQRSKPAVGLKVIVARFGSFHAACRAAGVRSQVARRINTDEELVRGFEDVCRDRIRRGLSGRPSQSDFRILAQTDVDAVRPKTLTHRFGPYRDFLHTYELYHKRLIGRAELLQRARAGGRPKRRKISAKLYAETLHRFDHRCQACGRRACDLDPGEQLHIDHIVPVAMGGTNHPENLTVKCSRDNLGKGARFIG